MLHDRGSLMKMIQILLVLCAFSLSATCYAGIDLGSIGDIYPIKEVDILEYVNAKAKGINFEEYIRKNKDRMLEKSLTALIELPKAPKNETRKVEIIYTLEQDIFKIDSKGQKQIIYPAGFQYNVLDYTTIDEQYVIINAENEDEINWFKEQGLPNCMLIISQGNTIKLAEKLKLPVYKLTEPLKDSLYVRYTPSVIYQEGNKLRIDEHSMSAEGGGKCRNDGTYRC